MAGTRDAVFWSGAEVLGRQALQFAVTIILARALTPDDFGAIAVLLTFTALAVTVADAGFSSALIQSASVDHDDESTVFWGSVSVSVLLAACIGAASSGIARLFDRPVLQPLAAVMALNVVIVTLGSIHVTLLTKRLEFQAQWKTSVVATAVSGGVAILLARNGLGVWALAVQTLLSSIITTAMLWALNPWRPGMTFDLQKARKLFRFGRYMLYSALLDILYTRLYVLLIGKWHGMRELGFYDRADAIVQAPVSSVGAILSRVALPVFSGAAQDPQELRRHVRAAVRTAMLVSLPLLFGLAAVAEPFVTALLGPAWHAAVPVLQVLCIAGALWPLHVINLNALIAQGHSRLYFRLEVAKKVLGPAFVLVGSAYGVLGIAWSQVAFGVVALFVNAYYTRRFLQYGLLAQLSDCRAIVVSAAVMAALVYWAANHWLASDALLRVFGLTALGMAVFSLTTWAAQPALVKELLLQLRQ